MKNSYLYISLPPPTHRTFGIKTKQVGALLIICLVQRGTISYVHNTVVWSTSFGYRYEGCLPLNESNQ